MTCQADCTFCAGTTCKACVAPDIEAVLSPCEHDATERHLGMAALVSRAATKPMPPLERSRAIEIEIADDTDRLTLAAFFDALAQKLRSQRSVKITLE